MVREYFKMMRVTQWVKNIFILVPIIYSQNLFNQELYADVLKGFFSFCFLSSLVYIFNDLIDVSKDRLHPKKRYRPIASGKISTLAAKITMFLLLLMVILTSYSLNYSFQIILSLYLILNLLYTLSFKNVIILDIISISAGFILRVLSGAYLINVEVSNWLILTTIFLSLFLAILKRRSELVLINEKIISRTVLQFYSKDLINQITGISASGLIICYALYTVSPVTVERFGTDKLVYSIIFVIFGVFRYLYLVFNKKKGENITEILLTDIPLILNIFLYFTFIVIFIYLK